MLLSDQLLTWSDENSKADHRRLAIGTVQGLERADRHCVIGGEHAVDLREGLIRFFITCSACRR